MSPICGCGSTAPTQNLAANDQFASQNRTHLDKHGLLAVHVMSSTVAGTMALLDATIEALGNRHRIAVIGGNYGTGQVGPRIRGRGMPPVQLRTVTAWHSCAGLVHSVLQELPLAGIDVLFFETVGKIADSASPNLGLHRHVTLLSATDSNDKLAELQLKLRNTDLVMISKAELLEVLPDIDPEQAAIALRMLGRRTPLIQTTSQRARLLTPWLQWIEKQLRVCRSKQPIRAPVIGGAAWG
jgi:hydrogenase nickel incorporation protein HypB